MKWTPIVLIFAACAFAQKPPKPPKPGLYATFKTEFGDMRALLFEKDTPIAVRTFVGLAQGTQPWKNADHKFVKKPLYDNTTFFRIIPGTAIQGGSPTGNNRFDCGFVIQDEILPGLRFQAGSLAVANGGPDTGSCQFFITTEPMKSWDGKYTIFGTVVEGEDIVEKMAHLPVHDEKPINLTISRIGPPPVDKKPKK
jgi:cyclophilin family peptidyl-prolyl cis-trans isomerase